MYFSRSVTTVDLTIVKNERTSAKMGPRQIDRYSILLAILDY
jgi:hypothetical protein